MRLGIIFNAVKRVILPCCLVLLVCFGSVMAWSSPAQASKEAGAVVKERAERNLDDTAGAGTTNRIKGKTQEELGRAQRQFGDEAEGTARQVRGKVQKNVGEAQSAAQDAAEDAAESADNLVDKVKDFFD
jgi:uncharacterized protein YjbJ (UPF0337 family)